MNTKKCNLCHQSLCLEKFGKSARSPDGKDWSCKKCNNLRSKETYEKKKSQRSKSIKKWQEENKEKDLDRKKQYYIENKDKFQKARKVSALRHNQERRERKETLIERAGGCCNDCGYKGHPAVFDFHHTKDKVTEVGRLLQSITNWEAAKKEAEKCVLLCSNCHRLRHNK